MRGSHGAYFITIQNPTETTLWPPPLTHSHVHISSIPFPRSH